MSELARQLIAENKRTRDAFLDLGNCGLTEVPVEVGELVWLESLSLAGEWLERDGMDWLFKESRNRGDKNRSPLDLGPLRRLARLRSLILEQVADLAPLAGLSELGTLFIGDAAECDLTPLGSLTALQSLHLQAATDLAPVAKLGPLRALVLDQTTVSDLRPLAHLSALQSLAVLGSPVSDLTPLAHLSALQELAVPHTQVSDLTPLARLSALRSVDLSTTPVSDLTPLAHLSALQELAVTHTQVSDLTPLARLSALQSVDLSTTPVSDLTPLAGLSAIKSLDVSRTRVSVLTPLTGMSALQFLDISNTPVDDVTALAGLSALESLSVRLTGIRDLTPLAALAALQTLDLWSLQVSDLTPLAGLSALQRLNVAGTLVSNLRPLAALSSLRSLKVGGTPVTDLTPLADLSTLQFLNVSGTPVRDLAPLSDLSALRFLDVSKTFVSDLSPLLPLITQGCEVHCGSHRWVDGIYVEGCPLTNPPPEIVRQGNEAILNYFEERARGAVDHLYEAKMLILGEGGAGKTSLLRRLYQPDQPLPSESETTKGITIYRHEFTLKNGRRFRLNVWDFGGQDIYHATHQFFLTRRSLYLLVDDTKKDHKSVSDEGFKYWLELIEVFGGHSPVLIFQNEKGGRSKAIDLGGIKGRYGNVKELYAGNLEHPDVADRLREGIEFFAGNLSHIGDELPTPWIAVRAEIETRAAESPYIPQQEYFRIYSRHLEFDRAKALHLSRYLHDLGVFLHFQDDSLLQRTVILQNQWATEAVFRILDDEAVKAQSGRFTGADCERLWRGSAYEDMQPELLALMQRFELCYELRDSRPATWLAPQLLPPAKPKELAGWGNSDNLVLRYQYGFLPKGIISRLTVRLHRFVRNPEMAWVTGVLFERDGTALLLELLANGSEIACAPAARSAKTFSA
jgi:Leucine-rich repeat (LRR) protein